MELGKNIAYQNKLKRLGHQLASSENLLRTHPMVKDKLTILQTTLHYLHLQMQWELAGPTARLLIIFRSALQGEEIEKSQTGFIGLALQRLQQGVAQLMHVALSPTEKEFTPLLLAFIQMMALTTAYIATQLVENGKHLFPQEDPAAAQKARLLLRELGLTFVLGSRAAESALRAIGQGLNLKEVSQQHVTHIGMFFLLSLLTLLHEEEQVQEDFFETIKRFMQPTLDSVEYALQQAQGEHLIDNSYASIALSQLQFMRHAIHSARNGETLRQTLANGLDALGLPYEEVKRDLKRLIAFCTQLNENFKNTFYQKNMTATTIMQSA
jgi:hypothetical protein